MVHGASAGGVRSFLGIPFAATTGGANRWKPPQPAAAWTTTLDATALGPICPQIDPSTMAYATTSDENCLTLNVWTPDPAPTKPLPVMVWIFGGAFVFGSGGAAPYSGNHLVPKGDVVVVSMNYRVGALGFLTHSGLAAEDPSHSSGNYGLLDQQAALKWVQTNIAAFGGDKTNVTIFGESAGGKSVCLQLLSPGSRGLFAKAIVESGLCLNPGLTLAAAEAQGDRFATAMGCTDMDSGAALSCLRALSPTALTNGPTTPPAQLPGRPLLSRQQHVAVLSTDRGRRLSDGSAGVPLHRQQGSSGPRPAGREHRRGHPISDRGARARTRRSPRRRTTWPRSHGRSARMPAPSPRNIRSPAGTRESPAGTPELQAWTPEPTGAVVFNTPDEALTQVSGDAFFVCQARRLERILSANAAKTYLYSFNGPLTGVPIAQLMGVAFHSSELPYVFGNKYLLGSVPDAGLAAGRRDGGVLDALRAEWRSEWRVGPDVARLHDGRRSESEPRHLDHDGYGPRQSQL